MLLSDEEGWHFVLGNYYLPENEQESNRVDSLSDEEQERIKPVSWGKIFDVEPFDNGRTRRGCFVQATFWELKEEMVVSGRKVKAKMK